MGLVPLIVTALVVGTLVSLGAVGTRGFHFLPSFILVSGFVLGIGLLVNKVTESIASRKRDRAD